MHIVVNCCPVPLLKCIDIGQFYSARETLCQGLEEEEKVDGIIGT